MICGVTTAMMNDVVPKKDGWSIVDMMIYEDVWLSERESKKEKQQQRYG